MFLKIRFRYVLLVILIGGLAIFYFAVTSVFDDVNKIALAKSKADPPSSHEEDYNIWLIFTKVYEGSPLTFKFSNLIANIINVTSIPLVLNIIVDNSSSDIAKSIIHEQIYHSNRSVGYRFYNITESAKLVENIMNVMTGFFSKPGSYYSDVLFYISLGLHRIAPVTQKRAILLDCDIYFKKDVVFLFDEFERFKSTALFGLAPELSPVYRHVLRLYRMKHNLTTFGNYYQPNITSNETITHPKGFQGYNSGVVLLKLDSIRNSKEYESLFKKSVLISLTKKYNFTQGHLGDQDFYTLIGCEYPHLIQTLNCGFNRQLCTWWRDNGYGDIFHNYFRCDHDIVVLHGNCNTKIPRL